MRAELWIFIPTPFVLYVCVATSNALTDHACFLQGGNVLANGTWVNVGGNQAVTYGGLAAASQTGGPPYDDGDGGKSCVFELALQCTTNLGSFG